MRKQSQVRSPSNQRMNILSRRWHHGLHRARRPITRRTGLWQISPRCLRRRHRHARRGSVRINIGKNPPIQIRVFFPDIGTLLCLLVRARCLVPRCAGVLLPLLHQQHKPASLFHNQHFLPRHESPPWLDYKVLPMYPSLSVTYVPGSDHPGTRKPVIFF